MTIGVILIGGLMFWQLGRWQGLYGRLPQKLSLNALYDGTLGGMEWFSSRITRGYLTGSVRDYMTYLFGFMIVVVGYALIRTGSLDYIGKGIYADITFYEAALAVVTMVVALAVLFARDRMMLIIFTGSIGYMVTLFFVMFRAPDLALTQMIIETVSVALFLLCFYHLPKLSRERTTIPFRLRNLLISVGVGLVVTIMALAATGSKLFDSISGYYVENSRELGGGDNIVNVILVDFRGFDTMLEITVLGIASLGIYALIKQGKERMSPLARGNKQRRVQHEDQ